MTNATVRFVSLSLLNIGGVFLRLHCVRVWAWFALASCNFALRELERRQAAESAEQDLANAVASLPRNKP